MSSAHCATSGATGASLYSFVGVTNHEWLGQAVAGVGDIDQDGDAESATSSFPTAVCPGAYVRVYSRATTLHSS